MSRTFEALQRAALEKKAKQNTAPPPDEPKVEVLPEPSATQPEETQPPEPGSSVVERATSSARGEMLPRPQGEADSTLTELLQEHLERDGEVVVESDGWVRGSMDREVAASLLKCYALLHCLCQDDLNWFWFWGSSTAATERARRCGLPLDQLA